MVIRFRAALAATLGALAAGCTATPAGSGIIAVVSSCMPCLMATDCKGTEVCTTLSGGSTLCAAPCTQNADCAGTESCYQGTTFDGHATSVCVEQTGACSPPASADGGDAGPGNTQADGGDAGTNNRLPGTDAGNEQSCPGYAAPDETGGSCPCQSGHTCTANNCYGGYYCDLSNNQCVTPPTNCSTPVPDAGTTPSPDAGTLPPATDGGFTSSITASGGTESQLFFAVIGDTRPYNGDDTPNYPATPPLAACTSSNISSVGTDTASCGAITTIFKDVQAMSPRPPFVISTGDYQYVTPGMGDSMTQLGYYQTARQLYSGIAWPAMGNHECDGFTASNCATGCPAGDTCSGSNTENFLNFQSLFLTPIGETLPYYTRTVTASDGSWTAHFIFVAPNYWNSTEQSWLTSALAAAGTSSTSNYIFVVHHEDATAGDPPSLSTIESAEKNVETVSIVGHSHTWAHGGSNPKELLVGNGGVPSTSLNNLGWTIVARQSNGQLVISNYDFMTLQVVDTYTVTP